MEMFSTPWWSALLAIILIDLVLAGDNAVVIALAARKLPAHLQRKAIAWGTAGAIGIRALMTLGVVWLLQIPGLMLVGGLGLLWIAYKLIVDTGEGDDGDDRDEEANEAPSEGAERIGHGVSPDVWASPSTSGFTFARYEMTKPVTTASARASGT